MYSAKLADKIILLQKGQILETGTHEELISKKGSIMNSIHYKPENIRVSDLDL